MIAMPTYAPVNQKFMQGLATFIKLEMAACPNTSHIRDPEQYENARTIYKCQMSNHPADRILFQASSPIQYYRSTEAKLLICRMFRDMDL